MPVKQRLLSFINQLWKHNYLPFVSGRNKPLTIIVYLLYICYFISFFLIQSIQSFKSPAAYNFTKAVAHAFNHCLPRVTYVTTSSSVLPWSVRIMWLCSKLVHKTFFSNKKYCIFALKPLKVKELSLELWLIKIGWHFIACPF